MIWYPYEQMKTMREPYKILDAEGVYLYTKDQKLIDSVSSWWCMIHGYKNPELTAAIKEQADHFCHVMLGGLTHEPVQKLSDKLQEYLPGDLDYCFFSDSGSVAVEVSLKMALQYNTNQGRKRPLVLALEHAYHGDTFKAMEVGDDEDYHFAFEEKTGVVHIPTEIAALEEAFEKYHDELNCFIVEPLLQGAGGMRMYDISFLKRARELCDAYDVLLIFDEVATGFGRTGSRFVADLVLPDAETSFEEYTTLELLSISMLIIISTFALDFIHSDRGQFKIVDEDEAWAFLQVASGKTLSNKLVRAGRSMNAGVYFVTQNTDDLQDEKMKNNIGLKFAFRSTDIQEIRKTLEFFGIDKNDEENQKRLRNLENGQCLMQDLYGRVDVVQIHPVFEDIFDAFDTRPPVESEEEVV